MTHRCFSFALVVALLVGGVLPENLCSQAPDDARAQRFDRWDRNGDGKLTAEELPANLRGNFARVDRDGDGFVSREEDAAVGRGARPGGADAGTVEKLTDLDYAGDANPRQAVDVYLPKDHAANNEAEALPLLVFIHGGGWRNGDKAGGWQRVRPFVESGKFAAASVGYRLSAEAQWPSQIHDCKAAIRFLKANAERFNIDPERIAVWGTSAGGHLVAMLGVSGDVAELEGEIGPHLEQNSEVACVVNFFGPADLLSMNGEGGTMDHESPTSPESLMVGGPILERQDIARQASPINHVSAADEPMLIVHGDEDPLVIFSQSVKLEQALEAEGVSVTLIKVEGGGHGKGFGPKVNEIVEAFLMQQLHGAEGAVADQAIAAGE